MARGWESKSVESQIESASERRAAATAAASHSPEQAKKREERDHLMMSRTRVLHDLEKATNPRYQEMLRASLEFLDNKLAELDRE